MNKLFGYFKCEYLKLNNNFFVITSICISFLFMIYISLDTFPYAVIQLPNYFISVFLLSLSIIGVLSIIAIGAFLISEEITWNTFHLSIVQYGRAKVYFIKIISIFVASLLLIFGTIIFAIAIHLYVGAPGEIFNLDIGIQIAFILFMMFFWGVITLVTTLFTKSAVFSTFLLFVINFFEPIVYTHLDPDLLKYFIVFNQKGILSIAFSNLTNDSFIMVLENEYPSFIWSFGYLLILLIFLLFIGYLKMKKSDIDN